MQHGAIDRSGREIGQADTPRGGLPCPISPIERAVAILPVSDGRHRLMIDGVGYGYAARPEILAPAARLFGGADYPL